MRKEPQARSAMGVKRRWREAHLVRSAAGAKHRRREVRRRREARCRREAQVARSAAGMKRGREAPQARSYTGAKRRTREAPLVQARSAAFAERRSREAPQARSAAGAKRRRALATRACSARSHTVQAPTGERERPSLALGPFASVFARFSRSGKKCIPAGDRAPARSF
jgi:hypothetical protein